MNESEERTTGVGAGLLLGVIRVYQKAISPLLGQNCRYYPSCSRYAHDAIKIHGAFRGSWFGVKRIGRCHPFRDGGFDPVPRKLPSKLEGSLGESSDARHQEPQGSMS